MKTYYYTSQNYYEPYLMHYGVKGMKWGVRRYKNADRSDLRMRYDKAKSEKKEAYKAYSKKFSDAYNYSYRHPVSQYIKKSKHYSKSTRLWEDAANAADYSNKKASKFKDVKKERKAALKSNTELVRNSLTRSDTYLYGTSIPNAAKLITDYNMDVSDALKQTKKEARRNTAIALSVYGAYEVGKYIYNRKE